MSEAGDDKGPLFDPFKEGAYASREDRNVREILRLIAVEQLSVREIARRTGKAPSTVRATLGRCRAAGLSWPLPEGLSDSGLEERLTAKAALSQVLRRGRNPIGPWSIGN